MFSFMSLCPPNENSSGTAPANLGLAAGDDPLDILPQATHRNGHAVLQHPLQLGLGHIVFFKIMQELLGCGGEIKLLS